MRTRILVFGLFLLSGLVAMANPAASSPVVVNDVEFPLTVGKAEYKLITIVQDFPAGSPGISVQRPVTPPRQRTDRRPSLRVRLHHLVKYRSLMKRRLRAPAPD